MNMRVMRSVVGSGIVALALQAACFTARAAEADDKSVCRKNLSRIHEGIQNFRKLYKRLPDRLADLLPNSLPNPEVLNCPTAKRLGVTGDDLAGYGSQEVADTRTTYLYEFRTNTIPKVISGGSRRTMREWKQLQMGVVGSEVPIVRCLAHDGVLNLSFGGAVYESALNWELNYEHLVRADDLSYHRLFNLGTVLHVVRVPPRPPGVPPQLVDLSDHYNASLTKCWTDGNDSNSLTNLPTGVVTFQEVQFDVRGLIQLRADDARLDIYPVSVPGIPVGLSCKSLHFLHAAAALNVTKPAAGTELGWYVAHYEDGRIARLSLEYGMHLVHWRSDPGPDFKTADTGIAWKGSNEAARAQGKSIFLYHTTWAHPYPETKIQTLEFISKMTDCGPFLVAVTAGQ